MQYNELTTAVGRLNGQLAVIKHVYDPSREFLAQVEYCNQRGNSGYAYLFWVDKRALCAYAETMTRVDAAHILSLEPSGLNEDELKTDHLGENWRMILNDPTVFLRRASS